MSELKDNQTSLNEWIKESIPQKKNRFSNIKHAINKAIAEVWIAGSLLWWTVAPEVASTALIPETAATITTMAPTTWAAVKAITLGTAAAIASACERPDITTPNIDAKTSIDISWWEQVRISGNQLYIWSNLVASRSDDVSSNCMVSVTMNGNNIVWKPLDNEWTINIKVTDEAGNSKNASVKVNVLNNAPVIDAKSEVNIFWWEKLNISNNQLLIWDEVAASRTDDKTANCKVSLEFKSKEIKSWDPITEAGVLSIKVEDDKGKFDKKDINITNNTIIGLENLKNLNMQVDNEVDLLKWISFADWVELVKVEVEIDNEIYQANDPHHYTPEYPWTSNIIFTIKLKTWDTKEIRSDTLTIKPLEYKALEITNIKPVDILPIIGQIESWDKNAYEHIEHLRVAEATKIRDMMREYGAGNHSKEEYQQLMGRLNTGMRWEIPTWFNNYEIMGAQIYLKPNEHAHTEYYILNKLINHTNFKLLLWDLEKSRQETMSDYIKNNPNTINIFWSSTYSAASNKASYEKTLLKKDIIDLCKSKNFIMFAAWTNIETDNWSFKNKIYNWEYEADEHGRYSLASLSNSDKNTQPNIHLLVTIATDADWDIDQTNETAESSKYPIWFADNVLFSGRTFPTHLDKTNEIYAEGYRNNWKYSTSLSNYFNVAIMDLCFQLFAEVKDVDQLLEMIRSTALTDYIRFNWETQELQLINPTWFIKKYLMPNNLPSSIQEWEVRSLEKWYYKWIIFDIPWAEVKIGEQWVPYNKENEFLIKSQNPLSLVWRINWDLLRKLWYKKWDTIKGKSIITDDEWNNLNIEKDIYINIE